MNHVLKYIWANMMTSAMNKKIQYLLYLVALILVIIVFVQIRGYYLFIKSPVAQLPEAFPDNTLAVIGAPDAAGFITTTRASGLSEVLTDAESNSGFEHISAIADSLAAEDETFRDLLENKPFMAGVVPDSAGKPQWLLAFSIGKQSLDKFNRHCKTWASSRGYDFFKVNHAIADFYTFSRAEESLHYFIFKGLLCISENESLLKSSLKSMDNHSSLSNDDLFMTLARTSGKNVDASLIIRTSELIGLLLEKNLSESPAVLFHGGWTTLDLTIRKDKLLLNGFTGTPEPLPLLAQETPLPMQMTGIPENTASIYGFLLIDPTKSIETMIGNDTIHTIGFDSVNNSGTKEIFRLREHLDTWMGHYSFKLIDKNKQEIIVIQNKQMDSTASPLIHFVKPIEPGITKITDQKLFKKLFGNMFELKSPVYCLNRPPLLAFSASLSALRNYDKSLNSPGIRDQAASMALLLNNAQEKASFFAMKATQNNVDKVDGWMPWLQKCQLLSFKLSAGEPFMYSSGVLYFEAPRKILAQESPDSATDSITDQPLRTLPPAAVGKETDIAFTPVIIRGERAGESQAAFFGKNSLTINDEKGSIIFEWQSPEPLMGQLYTTNYKQRDRPRYIVIGHNHLFHLSSDGSMLKKTKLPAGIASATGFFDYDRRNDYRIIYQDAGKKIYSITTEGKTLPDWQKPQTEALSMAPVFLRNAGKDYLFFSGKDGHLLITDRRGRERIKIYEGFKKSANAGIFENRTNAKGLFLTAAADGRLAYITDNGVISYSSFGHFGDHPYFEYADFDGDGSMDFMFAGNEKVGIYTRMKKSIGELKIKGGHLGKPFMYASSLGKSWIAVRDSRSGVVYLMNNKGEQIKLNNLRSDTDPIIFNPGGSRQIVMVTSLNNKPVFTTLK